LTVNNAARKARDIKTRKEKHKKRGEALRFGGESRSLVTNTSEIRAHIRGRRERAERSGGRGVEFLEGELPKKSEAQQSERATSETNIREINRANRT
jgi:hypothetical protein